VSVTAVNSAPTQTETPYYEMLWTRGISHKGWQGVAEHGPVPLDPGTFDRVADDAHFDVEGHLAEAMAAA
jgi:hypothetical protein